LSFQDKDLAAATFRPQIIRDLKSRPEQRVVRTVQPSVGGAEQFRT